MVAASTSTTEGSVSGEHRLASSFEDEVFAEMTNWERDIELSRLQKLAGTAENRPWTHADERQVLESPHFAASGEARRSPQAVRPARSWLSPVLLFLGVAGLACGLTFLGLSIWDNRPQLWQLGMPVIAFGQLGLILWIALEVGVSSPLGGDTAPRRTSGKRVARRTEQHEVLGPPIFTRSRRAARRGI